MQQVGSSKLGIIIWPYSQTDLANHGVNSSTSCFLAKSIKGRVKLRQGVTEVPQWMPRLGQLQLPEHKRPKFLSPKAKKGLSSDYNQWGALWHLVKLTVGQSASAMSSEGIRNTCLRYLYPRDKMMTSQ